MTNSTIFNIGKNITYFRNKAALTQEILSEMSNISCDYLSEIERGKKIPSIRTLIKITNALEIKADLLLSNVN